MKRPTREFTPKETQSPRRLLAILGVTVAAALFIGLHLLMPDLKTPERPPDPVYPPADSLRTEVGAVLSDHALGVDTLDTLRNLWRVRVPSGLPLPSLHMELKERIAGQGATVIQAGSDPVSGRVTLGMGWHDSVFVTLILIQVAEPETSTGVIALVIDDFGDRWGSTEQAFLSL